jgi:hypothetical protein
LYDAIDAAKPMFDEKYDKCVEDGMDENETCQQSNDDITPFHTCLYSIFLTLTIYTSRYLKENKKKHESRLPLDICLFAFIINFKVIVQQSNDDITPFVQKEFYKRYTTYLKLAIYLENNDVHEQIVHKIQSLIDEDVKQDTAIKRVLPTIIIIIIK